MTKADVFALGASGQHVADLDLGVGDDHAVDDLISATTTKTGLSVWCELDTDAYPRGISVSNQDMAALNITRDPFHGEWNYTIHPHKPANDAAIL